jgi:ornithine carbamoyltransferase
MRASRPGLEMMLMRNKNIWLFNAGNAFAGNPKWLFLYMQEYHPEVDCYWLCFKQELVEKLAEYGNIPVVNALTDDSHPCQAFAFAQTIKEQVGDFKGKTIAFIGDGNNVANSFLVLCAKLGMNFTLACPKGFEQPKNVIDEMQPFFKQHGTQYRVFNDPKEAVKDADILYSDVWVSMGQEGEKDSKQSHFLPFQINDDLLKLAPAHCKVSHCLPAHRGEEITDSVMDNLKVNLSFEEAENRLHAHKAVLWQLMTPTSELGK